MDDKFWQEWSERASRDACFAFRIDLRQMYERGKAVERWASIVLMAMNGCEQRSHSPLIPLYHEIIAVNALLEYIYRCGSGSRMSEKKIKKLLAVLDQYAPDFQISNRQRE